MANLKKLFEQNPDRVLESLGKGTDAPPKSNVVNMPAKKLQGRQPMHNFFQVQLDRIIADPNQPRTTFNEEALGQLAQSIREAGLENPIAIRWNEGHGKYTIVHGERRYRACMIAGLKSIPCQLAEDNLTPDEILSRQIIENIHRQDLLPGEEARAYAKLMSLKKCTAKQLATHLGWPQSTVSATLSILKLPDDLQQLVDSCRVSTSAVPELAKLKNEAAQRNLAEKILQEGLTVKQVQNAVRQRQGKPVATKKQRPFEETIRLSRGVKVVISAKNGISEAVKYEALQDALAVQNQNTGPRDNPEVAISDYGYFDTEIGPLLEYALANGIKLSIRSMTTSTAGDVHKALLAVLGDLEMKLTQLGDRNCLLRASPALR